MSIVRCAVLVPVFMLLAPVAIAAPIMMQRQSPYADGSRVAKKIRSECVELQTQLPAYTAQFAGEFGVDLKLVDAVGPKDQGQVLIVEITDAVSRGNAFVGHRKISEISGSLYRDGQRVAGFVAARESMGGAFGDFKGSCSVLGRTMKALGKDVAQWLKNPQDEAELGDY